MKKALLLFVALSWFMSEISAQNLVWSSFRDSITSFSSPRAIDLNEDGVKDIIIGGGTDGVEADNGIMAFDGVDGSLLWKRAAHDEIFVSANFQDINNDGIPDVFIGGRQAQFYAIDGSNGNLIWQFYPHPYPITPADSGLWNFYSPQFIPDVDGDALPDLLVANGGDHSLPLWEENRPPGHLMILNSATGEILAQAVVPDSAETYCSPIVIDLQNDGNLWVLYGTGGESLGGHFYIAPLDDLINNTLENSIELAAHPTRGFIAPPSVHRSLTHGGYDIIVQGFGGTIYKFNGETLAQEWATTFTGTESSAQPVLGNFTGGDFMPDVFAVLYKGTLTSYTDYYQVMLDGTDGSIQYIDSIGTLHFPSGNAIDLNNDGRDEAVISVTYHDNGYFHHKLHAIDFQNESINQIYINQAGVNLGCTPLIDDIDDNGLLDIVYVVRKDSLNPVGWKGINVFRYETDSEIPNAGIAWGSYIGTHHDGVYEYTPVDCGSGSVISSVTHVSPSCNGEEDGSFEVNLIDPLDHHTYLWSTGDVSSSLTDLPAGQYFVRVTNSNGCYEDYYHTLNDPYVISFGGIYPPTCPGDSDGMATVSSTGCPCMFNTCIFTWENGGTTAQNLALTPGYHTVTIEHPDGCIVSDSVLMPESAPLILDSIITHNSCFGGNTGEIELIDNPDYITTFSWSNGETTNHIAGLEDGFYEVEIADNRPCSQTLSFTIEQPDTLYFNYEYDDVSCFDGNDGSITIEPIGGTPTYTYTINGNPSTDSIASGLEDGTYTLHITDANGCISEEALLTIVQPDELSFSFITDDISCFGENDGVITIIPTGGTPDYTYSIDGNSGQDSIVENLTEGTYEVYISDENGCESDVTNLAITEPPVITLSLIGIDESGTGALDGTAEVIISGGTAPYSVEWNDSDNQTTTTASGLTNGWYTVTVTDDNGCVAIDSVYLNTLSIHENSSNSTWKIYPNPTTDELNIQVGGSFHYYILDMNGKQVLDGSTSVVNTSTLSSGVYTFRLVQGNTIHEKKLVIF